MRRTSTTTTAAAESFRRIPLVLLIVLIVAVAALSSAASNFLTIAEVTQWSLSVGRLVRRPDDQAESTKRSRHLQTIIINVPRPDPSADNDEQNAAGPVVPGNSNARATYLVSCGGGGEGGMYRQQVMSLRTDVSFSYRVRVGGDREVAGSGGGGGGGAAAEGDRAAAALDGLRLLPERIAGAATDVAAARMCGGDGERVVGLSESVSNDDSDETAGDQSDADVALPQSYDHNDTQAAATSSSSSSSSSSSWQQHDAVLNDCVVSVSSHPGDHAFVGDTSCDDDDNPSGGRCMLFDGSLTVIHDAKCDDDRIREDGLNAMSASMDDGSLRDAINNNAAGAGGTGEAAAGGQVTLVEMYQPREPENELEQPDLESETEEDGDDSDAVAATGLRAAGAAAPVSTSGAAAAVTAGGVAVIALLGAAMAAFLIALVAWYRRGSRRDREMRRRLDEDLKSVRTVWSAKSDGNRSDGNTVRSAEGDGGGFQRRRPGFRSLAETGSRVDVHKCASALCAVCRPAPGASRGAVAIVPTERLGSSGQLPSDFAYLYRPGAGMDGYLDGYYVEEEEEERRPPPAMTSLVDDSESDNTTDGTATTSAVAAARSNPGLGLDAVRRMTDNENGEDVVDAGDAGGFARYEDSALARDPPGRVRNRLVINGLAREGSNNNGGGGDDRDAAAAREAAAHNDNDAEVAKADGCGDGHTGVATEARGGDDARGAEEPNRNPTSSTRKRANNYIRVARPRVNADWEDDGSLFDGCDDSKASSTVKSVEP